MTYNKGAPADDNNPLPVTFAGSSAANPNANPATVYAAQQTVTASAVALVAQSLVNGIVIKAKSTNVGTTYVGASGVTVGTGYPLAAGEAISFGVTNASAIYIIGTASDVVCVAGN